MMIYIHAYMVDVGKCDNKSGNVHGPNCVIR